MKSSSQFYSSNLEFGSAQSTSLNRGARPLTILLSMWNISSQ